MKELCGVFSLICDHSKWWRYWSDAVRFVWFCHVGAIPATNLMLLQGHQGNWPKSGKVHIQQVVVEWVKHKTFSPQTGNCAPCGNLCVLHEKLTACGHSAMVTACETVKHERRLPRCLLRYGRNVVGLTNRPTGKLLLLLITTKCLFKISLGNLSNIPWACSSCFLSVDAIYCIPERRWCSVTDRLKSANLLGFQGTPST